MSAAFDYTGFFDHQVNLLKEKGNYRNFANLERMVGQYPYAKYRPCDYAMQEVAIWCSNDYLNMGHHSVVIGAMVRVAETCGAGAGGTRNISGTTRYHVALEEEVAHWHNKEAGLIFTSAYVANHTALYTLGKMLPNAAIISDARNHASMIRGLLDSRTEKHIFRHNDPAHLREILETLDPAQPKIVAFESVYSMSGNVAPMEELIEVAEEFDALIYVDEVHAVGLYGPTGAGIAEQRGLSDRIHIINGTFGKAVGVSGGYIAGDCALIDFIRSYGAGFIFTTSLSPAICGAVLESIRHLKKHPELREKHQARVRRLKTLLAEADIPFKDAPTHIVPVTVGDPVLCKNITDVLLYSFNIYVQPINYPTVPWGEECLRITPSPHHTDEQMDNLVAALKQVLTNRACAQFSLDYEAPMVLAS